MPSAVPTSTRRPDIQGLRAVAVLLVVAFHADLPLPGGFVGVDVFFVISGYVITAMLLRERLTSGALSLRRFYARRFKRLTPALALVVTVTCLVSLVVLSPIQTQRETAITGIGAMLLVANIVIARTTGGYFDAAAELNPLLNTWTLSVEEQFYLVFPAVLALSWLAARHARRRSDGPALTGSVIVVSAIAVLSFAFAATGAAGISFRGSELVLGFYSPVSRAWEFAAGALLALLGTRIVRRHVATLLGLAGVAVVGTAALVITPTTPFPGPWTLLPVAGAVLLIAAGSHPANIVSRALAVRPATVVGDWSYSVYLWHWPVIVLSSVWWPGPPTVIAAALSFIPAVASYRWLEEPLRLRPMPSPGRFFVLVVVVMAIPLAAGGLLVAASSAGLWSDRVRDLQSAVEPFHLAQVAGCATGTPLSQRTEGACTWNPGSPGPPVYLVGDSNADHISEGLVAASAGAGRPVIISTANACPLVAGWLERASATPLANEQCRAYAAGTLDDLASAPAGLVVLGASDNYWTDPDFTFGTDASTATADAEDKLAALRTELASTVRRLQDAGHEVAILQTVPRWTGEHAWDPAACTAWATLRGQCSAEMPLADALVGQGPVRGVVDSVAAATGAGVVDLWETLCSADRCRTSDGDTFRYRDAGHLTVSQSELLAPVFAPLVAAGPDLGGGSSP